MPDPLADLPPRFLHTKEAAYFLGLSRRTMEKHRTYGTGPVYRKVGGRVLYAIRDLEAWTEAGALTSTERATGIWQRVLADFVPPAGGAEAVERLAPWIEQATRAGGAPPLD